MLVLVVIAFAICWAPWQTYFLAAIIHPPVNHWKYINIMFFVFHWLAMSNSCYNPCIYGIFSEKFKREFRVRLACLPCCDGEAAMLSPNDSELEPTGFTSRLHSRRQTSRSSHQRTLQQVKTTTKSVIIISLHSNYILIIFQLYSSIFQLAVLNTWTQTTSRTKIVETKKKILKCYFILAQTLIIQYSIKILFNYPQELMRPWCRQRAMQKNYPHLK